MDTESLATVYNRTTDKLNFEVFIIVSLRVSTMLPSYVI